VQRAYWGTIGSNPPLFLVNGNHEQTARYLLDGTANSAPVIAANSRKKYFPLPEPYGFYSGDPDSIQHIGVLKDYYAFEWGNALFVVIDPYWHSEIAVDNQPLIQEKQGKKDLWKITIGDKQYEWLKKTLETSKAKFKFVFAHHVMGTGRGGIERALYYEWGGKSANGADMFSVYRPKWEMPIHQLMVKNKVNIFFQGHDHLFAKQELDGIIYQSVPNPADDTHTAFNKEAYQTGKILPNSGYLHVTVSPKEVKVNYARSFLNNSSNLPEIRENYTYTIK
jgi:Calcineurin-like phosphoesterase